MYIGKKVFLRFEIYLEHATAGTTFEPKTLKNFKMK